MSDNLPPGGNGTPFEPTNQSKDQVPLPPVAPPVEYPNSGQYPPAGPPPAPGGPGEQPPATPKRKGSLGRAILLTLLGMLVLFGLGFGLGQLFRSDKTTGGGSTPTAAACATVEVTPASVAPSEVTVDVLNTGAPAGSATKTGARLEAAGFKIGSVGNDTTSDTSSGAIIRYGASGEAAANTLKAWVTGEVKMELVERSDAKVTLLLQDGFGGVATEAEAQAALAKPSPSLSGPGCPTPTPSATTAAASPTPTGSSSESSSASTSASASASSSQ